MRRLFGMWLCVVTLIVLIGCTATEWSKIGSDAWEAAPEAVGDIASNPTPLGIAIVIGTFIAGLVSKSAARGFGKAGSKTAKMAAAAVKAALKRKEPEKPPE